LIREEWLKTGDDDVAISWDDVAANIRQARSFHEELSGKYHQHTYVFYGGGEKKGSFSGVTWQVSSGSVRGHLPAASVLDLRPLDVRTNGSNSLYVGGRTDFSVASSGAAAIPQVHESSAWDIQCERQDSAGDGTVPKCSGQAPRLAGGGNILQQFEVPEIAHEPAYRDYPTVRQLAYYAITKLAALAVLP
jgi:hypothetical protein